MTVIAFDIYGTLIDTQGVLQTLEDVLDDKPKAQLFSNTWRDKQLEYSFRRGLMQNYQNFAVCTEQALHYCDLHYQTQLSAADKQRLLACYKTLPAFNDVENCLIALNKINCQCYAFSNGTADAVEGLLGHANIRHYFKGIVSVDAIQTFKPNPKVYQYFAEQVGVELESVWLVSSNPFDILGAAATGLNTVWLQRSKSVVFDPWELSPARTINSLEHLVNVFDI